MPALFLASLLSMSVSAAAFDPERALSALKLDARQALWVSNDEASSSSATVYALERSRGSWRVEAGPLPAVVGRAGLAAPGDKREGDGRTPSGVYPLPLAFGYAAAVDSRMPYRQSKEDDVWVDDPGAPDYNTWVKRGATSAQSFELMRRADDRYKLGLVVAYNTSPIVKGKGSAIFVHVWGGPGVPSAGCVALAENDLAGLLKWLDPKKKPVIVISRGR